MPHQPPTSLAESLSGLIERVTFFNEENGYGVLKVKAKGHRDLVTVVGSLPSVSPGEWLTAQGRWVQDREFGLQFKAEMLIMRPPFTKPLESIRVKGHGPAMHEARTFLNSLPAPASSDSVVAEAFQLPSGEQDEPRIQGTFPLLTT